MAKKKVEDNNRLYDDLMVGFEELSEFARGERQLRVTTLETEHAPAVIVSTKTETAYVALFERGPRGWVATVPDLPGCASKGDTAEEAEANVRLEIVRYIEAAIADGETVPAPAARAKTVLVRA